MNVWQFQINIVPLQKFPRRCRILMDNADGLGTNIWKGVTVRFEFDVLRISQVRTTSQVPSNANALGMIILPSFGLFAVIGTIYHSVWGFRVARF